MKYPTKVFPYHSFLAIWISHLVIDFMLGIWPIFKILAGLDLALAGAIMGLSMFLGESSQLIFGFFSDRGHHRKLLILGLVLASSVALFGYSNNYYFLFALILSLYIGAGAFHPAAVGMIGSWSSSRKGLLLTLFSAGGMAGAAVSQRVFTSLYQALNGHTFFFFLPTIILGLIFFWISLPRQKFQEKPINLYRLFKWTKPARKELYLLYGTQVLMQTIICSFTFLLPDLLYALNYEPWFYYGGAHSFFILGSALMSVPMGYLSDKYCPRVLLILAVLASILCFYTFLISGPLPVYFAGAILFLLGSCIGTIHPIIVATANRLVPTQVSGMISGLMMGGATSLAGLGVMCTGFLGAQFMENSAMKTLQIMGILFLGVILMIFFLSPFAKKSSATLEPSLK